ncbi:MAG: Glu/Leu/Phe/Val dehydrogenase [Eubacteriales bacterium]|nr:Glu/Leu/Phe/Val dehydrogenase [Eubacteriales bacterium]
MSEQKNNPLVNAQLQVKKACDVLGLDASVYEVLKEPYRFIEIAIPVKMDDGSVKVFKGFRSQHNAAVGPTKGGLRFHPGVHADEVKALSIWMTFKCSITGIPYGGGKGGIICNPKEMSDNELEQLARGFVRGMHKYLGEKMDIPAPDVNTNAQIMSWMVDEYIRLTGSNDLGVFTGKSVTWGGSKGRTEATGLGVAISARRALEKAGKSVQGAKIAVQGFGNVGSFTVKNLIAMGAKVVAVLVRGKDNGTVALYRESGLSYEELQAEKDAKGYMYELADVKLLEDEMDFWGLDVDVICPCALENAIDTEQAKAIRAGIVVEGANGPVTIGGDEVLKEKGVIVVPDILANAGGVTVSYFEWVQNRYGYYWSEEEVAEKERIAMMEAFDAIWKVKEDYNITVREAAYVHSVKHVAEVMKLRGWV